MQQSIIFPTTSDTLSTCYRHARNNLAEKYNMPELKQVQLYDFRRRKATREYKLSGHNFLHVKKILGHKDARSTEKYITEDEQIEWLPIKAVTDEEKNKCIEEDCEFIAIERNGAMWFKKPHKREGKNKNLKAKLTVD